VADKRHGEVDELTAGDPVIPGKRSGILATELQRHPVPALDKVLSFDDDQEAVYRQSPPLVIIGSAGCGKTALTPEKMQDASGHILYVTRSPFLVQNGRDHFPQRVTQPPAGLDAAVLALATVAC
jgi:hypothetical protein